MHGTTGLRGTVPRLPRRDRERRAGSAQLHHHREWSRGAGHRRALVNNTFPPERLDVGPGATHSKAP